ncbi:DUF2092 domain-containing protein [Agrobacterium pusense]|uniref:DUF2092 domain-containing protein n=1 Tax=Agrobacterium pusense TaxID=648995 RepID=UPI00088C3B57|nr:DUF2092 domain-containing protein [Agrobacterium pusense]OOO19708.1 hypothetical protein BTE56_13370 [Agrobacterium pusense]WKD47935.1 DUF2092 domain-containing protein [Agrobacterium pusense]SDF63954.1 hypothetical protein SAMN05421750_12029 [Agrobacterium pusense]
MKMNASRLVVATAALLLTASGLMAQEKRTTEPRIEPESVEALKKMGDHLQSLKVFGLKATTTTDVVLDNDQKLEIGGTATYEVRRPDRLRIDLATDVVHGELVYDGKTLVYASPDQNVYAQVPAPPTIKEALEEAAQKYDLSFPLADLFSWGTPDAPIDLIKEGFFVGHAFVNGRETDHWAFRGADQDAEIWIATEGGPLPLKISLVDREDLTRPRITSVLEWTENATIADDVFAYKPAEGAQKIRFLNEEDRK